MPRSLELNQRQVRLLDLLEAGKTTAEIAREFGISRRTTEMQLVMLLQLFEVRGRPDLIATWRRTHEEGHPERIGLPDIGPRTPGARCCRNPECACAGKWVRGTMVPNQDGKLICNGCYVVYEPREVIDAASEDFGRFVRLP